MPTVLVKILFPYYYREVVFGERRNYITAFTVGAAKGSLWLH